MSECEGTWVRPGESACIARRWDGVETQAKYQNIVRRVSTCAKILQGSAKALGLRVRKTPDCGNKSMGSLRHMRVCRHVRSSSTYPNSWRPNKLRFTELGNSVAFVKFILTNENDVLHYSQCTVISRTLEQELLKNVYAAGSLVTE